MPFERRHFVPERNVRSLAGSAKYSVADGRDADSSAEGVSTDGSENDPGAGGPRASPEIRRRAEAVFREPRRSPLVCSEFTRDLAVDRRKRYRICHRRSIIK